MPRCTFQQLRDAVIGQIMPMGEAENLVDVHTKYLIEGLIDLQRYVRCFQERNTHQVPFCATLFKCGTTVMALPRGRIRAVYTVNSDWCDPVYYDGMEYPDLLAYARSQEQYTSPVNKGLPVLGQGFKYAEKTTDSTCGMGRTRFAGMYAKEGGRIYLAPFIQSNESVVIEYDGIKRSWLPTDLTTDDQDVVKALGLYILTQKAVKQGCNSDAYIAARKEYQDAFSDLYFECEKELEVGENRFSNDDGPMDVRTDDKVTDDPPYVLAAIGDYGWFSQISQPGVTPEEQVADLVKSWGPSAIISLGDNNYPDGAVATIDANIGQFYSDYIYPYKGAYGIGEQADNHFWPVLGNHDWDTDNGQPYLDYFTLPGKKRYYDLVLGPIHFFFIDTDAREPDGNTEGSIQATWVQQKVAQSTVQWKVLIGHEPPWSSDVDHAPGNTSIRWHAKEWGFDAAIFGHGHSYERFDLAGFPVFVNGSGGAPLRNFVSPPTAGSVMRYNAQHGALKIEATCDYLRFTFINSLGVTIETLELAPKLATA